MTKTEQVLRALKEHGRLSPMQVAKLVYGHEDFRVQARYLLLNLVDRQKVHAPTRGIYELLP